MVTEPVQAPWGRSATSISLWQTGFSQGSRSTRSMLNEEVPMGIRLPHLWKELRMDESETGLPRSETSPHTDETVRAFGEIWKLGPSSHCSGPMRRAGVDIHRGLWPLQLPPLEVSVKSLLAQLWSELLGRGEHRAQMTENEQEPSCMWTFGSCHV